MGAELALHEALRTRRIAVVIPCYKVVEHVLGVIARIGPEVERIYAVDDKCPAGSGDVVETRCADTRVRVLRNAENLGVGGAVLAGYRAAIDDGMDIVVKVDGDGQMDPRLIPQLVAPIALGAADYAKGNRFYSPEALEGMPIVRLVGNAGLSFLTKLSSGYWDVLDPTNGFTAIDARVADVLPLHKIARRYFFESDLLFRLNTVRAVVVDIPMFAHYGDEKSNMRVGSMLAPFFFKNLANFCKRIFYSYFLRGFSFASLSMFLGLALTVFGLSFGVAHWAAAAADGRATPVGTVMIAAVSLIMGFQMLLAFFAADIASIPQRPLHKMLAILPSKPLRPFRDLPRDEARKTATATADA